MPEPLVKVLGIGVSIKNIDKRLDLFPKPLASGYYSRHPETIQHKINKEKEKKKSQKKFNSIHN